MIILLYISVILLKALGDGLNDSSHKNWGHAFISAMVLLFLSMPYIVLPAWHIQVISFTLFMIALFDYAYNIGRGLPISFIGTTPWWDMLIKKVPFHFMLFVRIICLIVGIFLIINS